MINRHAWIKIGKKIRAARIEKGLNQVDLARVLGKKSITTISGYETGQKRIDFTDIKKLCNLLNIDITTL